MSLSRSLAALVLLPLFAVAAPPPHAAAAPLVAADDEENRFPDEREEIEELCDAFRDHIKARGEEDAEAIAVMDRMLQEFPVSGPKDREDIVEAIGRCFKERRRELEDGERDNRLYLAAAVCLGEMGPESAEVLEDWIGHKKHRKDIALQMELILSLGRTKHPDGVDVLLDLLKDDSFSIISAAAQALGNYAHLDQKVRKDIVNDLVRLLIDAKTAMDDDVTDTTARELYDTIAAPTITTLQALTGHDERAPEEWQRWWNKNKKEDWDGEE